MNDTNPHENAALEAQRQTRYAFLRKGTVTSAPDQQSGGEHHAFVQEVGIPADKPLPVLPSVHGDLYVPPEGAPVAIAPISENNYAVVGSPIPPVDTPAIDPGERIISHPLSGANVRFNKDGSIDIKGDADVRINGGDQGAITDVSVSTTTDADGHVTSVSLNITRENSILI